MCKILIFPQAKKDIAQSIKWYEDKAGEYTSERFKTSVFTAIKNLKNDAVEHSKSTIGLNRVFLKKFPFIIYYLKDKNAIIIFGVLHNKRSNRIIGRRL